MKKARRYLALTLAIRMIRVLFCWFLDIDNKKLYVWDEFYEKALSNRDIFAKINSLGYGKEKIIADSAEPKSIDELKYLGIRRIKGAKKGKDSINNGIQWIQDWKLLFTRDA